MLIATGAISTAQQAVAAVNFPGIQDKLDKIAAMPLPSADRNHIQNMELATYVTDAQDVDASTLELDKLGTVPVAAGGSNSDTITLAVSTTSTVPGHNSGFSSIQSTVPVSGNPASGSAANTYGGGAASTMGGGGSAAGASGSTGSAGLNNIIGNTNNNTGGGPGAVMMPPVGGGGIGGITMGPGASANN